MSRDDGGHWLPIHTGLLDDERFMNVGGAREAWLVLYLALDREPMPGWFRDRARVVFLLRKHGVSRPTNQVEKLESAGWLVSNMTEPTRVTLRKWDYYTGTTARKGVYNRLRDTTREGRGACHSPVETGGDLDETRRDESTSRAGARKSGARLSPQPTVPDGSFGEIMDKMGLDRETLTLKERPS